MTDTSLHQSFDQGITLAFYLTSNSFYVILHHETYAEYESLSLNGCTQAEVAVSFLDNILQNIDKNRIVKIITPSGPGSFTSIRVGLSIVLGLQIALPNAKIYTPNFFDILLWGNSANAYAVIDSKRGDFFVKYNDINVPLILNPDDFLHFQNTHHDWLPVYDPELISYHNDVPYPHQLLLDNMIKLADNNIGYTTIIEPYYVFQPEYKKISNK